MRSHAWWPVWLPRGGLLPEPVWRSRHRAVTALLGAHVAVIPVYALLRGTAPSHALVEALPALAALLLATRSTLGRTVTSGAAALGLMTCSGILVHLSGGMIEAHFHFFVMIPVVALYEAWTPFALGVGYVLVHHGVMGTLDPRSVYNHAAAWEHPWLFAGVHAALFASACAACLVNWWLHEQSRRAEWELMSSLAHSAEHDPLTGLPNRTAFLRMGSALTPLGPPDPHPVSVLVFDIDGFIQVNDTLGHLAGDHLVEQVAQRLAEAVRPYDVLCRLGGDEFAVLLRDVDADEVQEAAAEFLALFEEDFVVDGTLLRVDAHIGVASGVGAEVDHLATLLRRADVAMREAKRTRGGIVAYDPDTDHHTRARLALLAELRGGIERGELVLHFQPKVSLDDDRVVGVEALVRWQHPQHGLLGPDAFIPAVEHTPLISTLTSWVIDATLDQVQAWRTAGRALPIAVNVSPRCLLEPDFADRVLDALARAGVEGRWLRLEIIESTLLADPDRARGTLQRLSDAGIGLSIDDFGTGYSSMSYLRELPIDELKVDRSFVAGMLTRREDAVLVRSAIDLGRNLGLSVVAEGVETAEGLLALREAGCDVVQGYHFSRPLPADRLVAWCEQSGRTAIGQTEDAAVAG